MPAQVERGQPITLEGDYRLATGALVDPDAPTVDIVDPAGVTILDNAVPARTSIGHFELVYPTSVDAELGLYEAHWRGVINGVAVDGVDFFEVVPVGAPAGPGANVYGASLDDVQALLPDLVIGPTSKPTDAQVLRFLAMAADRVQARIGDVTAYPAWEVGELDAALAGIVAMGAAGLTDNAAHPDRAGKGQSSYGDWLWGEFLKAVDEMLESLQKPVDEGAGGVVELAGARPAYSLPEPTFWRDTAF